MQGHDVVRVHSSAKRTIEVGPESSREIAAHKNPSWICAQSFGTRHPSPRLTALMRANPKTGSVTRSEQSAGHGTLSLWLFTNYQSDGALEQGAWTCLFCITRGTFWHFLEFIPGGAVARLLSIYVFGGLMCFCLFSGAGSTSL